MGGMERQTYPDEVRHACMCRHAVSMGRRVSDLNPISSSCEEREGDSELKPTCSLKGHLDRQRKTSLIWAQKGHLLRSSGGAWTRLGQVPGSRPEGRLGRLVCTFVG